jgi:hypothetical protein
MVAVAETKSVVPGNTITKEKGFPIFKSFALKFDKVRFFYEHTC